MCITSKRICPFKWNTLNFSCKRNRMKISSERKNASCWKSVHSFTHSLLTTTVTSAYLCCCLFHFISCLSFSLARWRRKEKTFNKYLCFDFYLTPFGMCIQSMLPPAIKYNNEWSYCVILWLSLHSHSLCKSYATFKRNAKRMRMRKNSSQFLPFEVIILVLFSSLASWLMNLLHPFNFIALQLCVRVCLGIYLFDVKGMNNKKNLGESRMSLPAAVHISNIDIH